LFSIYDKNAIMPARKINYVKFCLCSRSW